MKVVLVVGLQAVVSSPCMNHCVRLERITVMPAMMRMRGGWGPVEEGCDVPWKILFDLRSACACACAWFDVLRIYYSKLGVIESVRVIDKE